MIYGMDDTITYGRIKQKTPRRIIEKNKHKIFDLIKNGLEFSDEVLKEARITKTISNERVYLEICEHKHETSTKKLPTDKAPIGQILEELANLGAIDKNEE